MAIHERWGKDGSYNEPANISCFSAGIGMILLIVIFVVRLVACDR